MPGDRAGLVQALAGLLADPEYAAAMGREGRRRFLAEFTAESFERRFEPRLEAWLEERVA